MANIYFFSKQNVQQAYKTCEKFLNPNTFYEITKASDSKIAIYVTETLTDEQDKQLKSTPGYIKKEYSNCQTPALKSLNSNGFTYNSVKFDQNNLNIIAGLNAIDNIDSVESVFRLLNSLGLNCARAGVYKPRTSPYSFQGLGKSILEQLFASADQYGIKAIAIEVLCESHVDEVLTALEKGRYETGVILQIGTRNAQNFELLKYVGKTNYPILYKRGFGISLLESIQACEYIAQTGNEKIIFCLRGLKSIHANPHRNICDFSQLPIINRMLNITTCSDPSHSIGNRDYDKDNIMDIAHVTAQAVVAGTNSLLIDIHPEPHKSPVDSKQVLNFEQFRVLVKDIKICRETYIKRKQLYLTNDCKNSYNLELDYFAS